MITSIPTTSRVVTLNGAPLSDLASAPVRVHEKYVEPGTAESSTAATTPVSEACRSGSPLAEGSVSESGQCTTHSAVTAKEADADETCAGRYAQVFMPRSYGVQRHSPPPSRLHGVNRKIVLVCSPLKCHFLRTWLDQRLGTTRGGNPSRSVLPTQFPQSARTSTTMGVERCHPVRLRGFGMR